VNREPGFLPDQLYRFIGLPLVVRSNSQEVLDFLNSAYRYFLVDNGRPASPSSSGDHDEKSLFRVTDHIGESQELLIEDSFQSCTLRCEDIFELKADDAHSKAGIPHPLAYVQWSVLQNIASRAEDYYLIHAGAVSWGDNALIFPGVSGRGKTTLCLGLLGQGFKLLSDELACLHRNNAGVAAFPRAARFDERSRALLGIDSAQVVKAARTENENAQWFLDVTRAFPDAIDGQSTLRYLIFLRGFAEDSRLDPLSQTTALIELFKQCVQKPENRVEALFEFARVIRNVRCFNLVMGKLDETTALLRGLVDGPGRSTGGRPQ